MFAADEFLQICKMHTGTTKVMSNGMKIGGPHGTGKRALTWLLVALASLAPIAHADVHLPNGEYRTTATDLVVKTRGGSVAVARTWQAVKLNKGQFRWYPNPAWADLDLTLDSVDGSIKSIGRTGAVFEKQGTDLYVLKESDRSYFIRVVKDGSGTRSGLTWSDRLGNTIDYDAAGQVTQYQNRNGVAVILSRDAAGHLTSVSDSATPAHTLLTFTWNGDQLASVSDYAGRTVQYHYTGSHLTGVTDVLGHVWTYTYQGGLLRTQADPDGHTTTIDYQGNRVVKVTDAQGYATTYSYDYDRGSRQYTVVTTSPEGQRTAARYDADGKLRSEEVGTRSTTTLVKDGANVEITTDERGLRTRTEYDANHNAVKVTYPDGATTTATYDGAFSLPLTRIDELGVATTYQYAKGNLTTMTEAVGRREQRITTATYDVHGQRLTQTVKGASPAEDATTTWTYDAFGNVATLTDAEGQTTTLAYDAMGNVVQRTDPRGKVWASPTNAMGWVTRQSDPLGHETTFGFDAVGNRTSITDAEHHTTTTTYTANHWLETVTDPLGAVTTTHYAKDGQRKEEVDANGVTTTYSYDTDRRLVTITDGTQNATTLIYGKTCANQPALGLEGVLTATRYPTYCEEYKVDPRGNRTQVIRVLPGANGAPDQRQATTMGYDAKGQKLSESDPLARTTQSAYDGLGRLSSVTDATGGLTGYTYDTRDNLKTVTDANQHTHTFTYDKASRVKTEARPLGETIGYAYDENGNLTKRTSARGERRVYGYDDANRRTTENQYPPASQSASQTIAYAYTDRNLLGGYTQTGDTQSSATYAYDPKGQKLDETVTYGTGAAAFSKTIHYAYQANGLKTKLTYPDGTEQTSTYDANRLATIQIKGTTIAYQNYIWHVPTIVTMPGATRTLTYDPLQRPTEIKSQAIGSGTAQAPTGPIIMDYRYTYDAAGNIRQRTTEDGDYLYTYDALDRLTGATPPISLQQGASNPNGLPVEKYTYDAVHNRKTSAHQLGEWAYNANNELKAYGTGTDVQTYDYDANGNTSEQKTGDPATQRKTRDYLYNAAERLSEVKDNGVTIARYQYDPMGRRFRKETNAGVNWFEYADEGLIAEYAGNGTVTRTHGQKPQGLWGTDQVWLADIIGPDWTVNLYYNDHVGTSQRLTDTQGAITWKMLSEAFGTVEEHTSITDNPLRFPGQYYDSTTQTVYNFARTYNATTGRYIESDPLSLTGGVNVYAYAHLNPILEIDPLGLFSYNHPPPTTKSLSGPALALANCLEHCLDKPFIVTGGSECTPDGRHVPRGVPGSRHCTNQAFDIAPPRSSEKPKVLCCSLRCGAGFVGDEGNHLHIQTVPGQNSSDGLLTSARRDCISCDSFGGR